MAGHRDGRARRSNARQQRMRGRLSAATTAEDQLAAAYDWFRMSARRAASTERPRLLRRASEFLAGLAAEIDGGQ